MMLSIALIFLLIIAYTSEFFAVVIFSGFLFYAEQDRTGK